MKRKYSRSLLVLLVIFVGISCENQLIEKPKGIIDPAGYYRNFIDCQTALNGAYSMVSRNQAWGGNMFIINNGGTDEVVMRDESSNGCYIGCFLVTPDNSQEYEDVYQQFYKTIAAANYIFDALDAAEMKDTERNIIEGQVLFLRAWCHLQLTTLFGGIVIADKSKMEIDVPRSSIQDVFEKMIIPGLLAAHEMLPAEEYASNRPNKYVVESFLAWVYNYLATAKTQGMGNVMWEEMPLNSFDWVNANDFYIEALKYTTSVLNAVENGFFNKKLVANYAYLFRNYTMEIQQEEFLWTAPTTELGDQLVHVMIGWGLPKGKRDDGGGQDRHRPTLEAFERYNDADIRKWNNITGALNTKVIEDINGKLYYGVDVAKNNATNYTGKYRYIIPAYTQLPNGAGLINIAYMRLAEVYLMHAEALYFNGREAEARLALNPIRLRAAGYDQTKAETLTTAYYRPDFIQELLDERSREFYIEGKRRLDLFRFGYQRYENAIFGIDQTRKGQNKNMLFTTRNYDPKKIWGPIPAVERGLNSKLIQNLGY